MKWLWYGLRIKLNVNISSQVWFIIAADLKEETKCVFSGGQKYHH